MAATSAAGDGIFSATYNGFAGADSKREHVMRRQSDNWVNATHILKAAGFDKPARTRILERDVQKGNHEKVQGGYGKFQGTYLPLQDARELARQHNVLDRLRPIFDFVPGAVTPPPAPRHASKPKQPKKAPGLLQAGHGPKRKHVPRADELDTSSVVYRDESPDNQTIVSGSYMAEDEADRMIQHKHTMYGESLLDYYALDMSDPKAPRPEPPTNFRPDFPIDKHRNTALHWASAMGDIDGVRHMKRFGPSLTARNMRGVTPLMHAVNFTNAFDKQTFPAIMDELLETIDARDLSGRTVLHHAVSHAVSVKHRRPARYYVESLLARLQGSHDATFTDQFINAQDQRGDTAIHLAAENKNTKIIRSLLGRNASTSIPNQKGVYAEEMIRELNEGIRSRSAVPPPSSSPFAPPPPRRPSLSSALHDFWNNTEFHSEAAKAVQNRIAPSMLQKSRYLAECFEDEWKEKDEAEQDARRLLASTQDELAAQLDELRRHEDLLEADEVAAKTEAEATQLQTQVLSLLRYQNRIAVQGKIHTELSMQVNGNNGQDCSSQASRDNDQQERLRLAQELRDQVRELRKAESELVGATGLRGVGEAIESYRYLLQLCLGPQAPGLDDNLDSMIREFEEEADYPNGTRAIRGYALGNGGDADAMELSDVE
ncbi:apses-domain-containing protein [Cryphonectria parasitica EP155]|uniref:Apses-domain-containing protein n=1 Tax=Cryphonectria parasitica (strain ATCC 38755 / EP155) TaxID=660469 RepID=A0A9P5CIC2_CRYP1|nr:apses-domain-containing protein [Cryphonectria parasitica EP155]KAF3760443.1 apses-domain-containing protein [Cryphonectria parasitica EP155]